MVNQFYWQKNHFCRQKTKRQLLYLDTNVVLPVVNQFYWQKNQFYRQKTKRQQLHLDTSVVLSVVNQFYGLYIEVQQAKYNILGVF